LAGLLEYFSTHHRRPNLKLKSFTRAHLQRTLHRGLGLGLQPAGEQAADPDGGESGEAEQQKLTPPASRPHQRPGVQARLLQSSSE
jgi:hypothetical protein